MATADEAFMAVSFALRMHFSASAAGNRHFHPSAYPSPSLQSCSAATYFSGDSRHLSDCMGLIHLYGIRVRIIDTIQDRT
jgi:hypothetical protein